MVVVHNHSQTHRKRHGYTHTYIYLLSIMLHRFLTGPANLKDPEAKFRFPRIFVHTEDGSEELHLIVYKVSHWRY